MNFYKELVIVAFVMITINLSISIGDLANRISQNLESQKFKQTGTGGKHRIKLYSGGNLVGEWVSEGPIHEAKTTTELKNNTSEKMVNISEKYVITPE